MTGHHAHPRGTRLDGAITAVRQAVAAACGLPVESIEPDEDLIRDVCLDSLERESLSLIVLEVFGIVVPEQLFLSPLYRTPAALAEWVIGQSDSAAWTESRHARQLVKVTRHG